VDYAEVLEAISDLNFPKAKKIVLIQDNLSTHRPGRIPEKLTLAEEVAAWEASRNKKLVRTDWHFTSADARVKLKRLYPAIDRRAGPVAIMAARWAPNLVLDRRP
jgi:hypothetical protein